MDWLYKWARNGKVVETDSVVVTASIAFFSTLELIHSECNNYPFLNFKQKLCLIKLLLPPPLDGYTRTHTPLHGPIGGPLGDGLSNPTRQALRFKCSINIHPKVWGGSLMSRNMVLRTTNQVLNMKVLVRYQVYGCYHKMMTWLLAWLAGRLNGFML